MTTIQKSGEHIIGETSSQPSEESTISVTSVNSPTMEDISDDGDENDQNQHSESTQLSGSSTVTLSCPSQDMLLNSQEFRSHATCIEKTVAEKEMVYFSAKMDTII